MGVGESKNQGSRGDVVQPGYACLGGLAAQVFIGILKYSSLPQFPTVFWVASLGPMTGDI